ncbi:MAG: hypothetical protein AAF590_05655 [Pseudomonadota bacterium]
MSVPPSSGLIDVRRVYFQTLKRVVAGLLQSSDDVLVDVAARLDASFDLLDKRDAGGLAVRVDRNDSGLPILADTIALSRDVAKRAEPEESSKALKEKLLDEMMERRRVPRPLQLQEIGRAIYHEAVRGALPVFWPEGRSLSPRDDGRLKAMSWDHWDGGTNRPIFTQAWVEYRQSRAFPHTEMQALARKFSGSGFTPLAAAIEFDDAFDDIALKRLKRWTLGPFYSPIFMDIPMPLIALFRDLPVEDAWMFVWHVDEVISVGTKETKSWFLAPTRYSETYAVDTTDGLATERGASASRGHALLPHRAHQKLMAVGGSVETLTRGMRIHSLSPDGKLFEDI